VKRTFCLNNEKQISVICALYRQDYNGWWPYHVSPYNPVLSGVCYWPYYFWYLGYAKKSDRTATDWMSSFDFNLHCPEREPYVASGKTDRMSDYTMIAPEATYGGGLSGINPGDKGCRETQIRETSLLIVFGDAWYWDKRLSADYTYFLNRGYWPDPITTSGRTALSPWTHNLGGNYLYADGHAGWISAREINYAMLTYTQNPAYCAYRPDFTMYHR
jgi:prepilin-type processing-associated H-X9-DG protein